MSFFEDRETEVKRRPASFQENHWSNDKNDLQYLMWNCLVFYDGIVRDLLV
jgi:hypothetical protein